MSLPIRNSVRVLLFNEQNELLLICADDPNIGNNKGRFWFVVGGEREKGESLLETAAREVFEEAGIEPKDIEFGPPVWYGEIDLMVNGILTHLKQTFIVARTKQKKVSLNQLDQGEKKVIKEVDWFSLERIMNSKEPVYPKIMSKYLPDIIEGRYPEKLMIIDL